MKLGKLQSLLAFSLLAAVIAAPASVRYVDVNSATPTSPYTNWASAAGTIQDAVDVAVVGDQILVTNGVYQTGARRTFGASGATGGDGLNRVAVQSRLTIQSVNGPEATSIVGYQVPGTTNGPAAVRCAYLSDGARLVGFTLTNGATEFGMDGGGVYCKSMALGEVVSNCVMVGNSADYQGGGSFRGTLWNCTLKDNSVLKRQGQPNNGYGGGGACSGRLNDCVLMGNRVYQGYGGGAAAEYGGSCTLSNCTLTGNIAYQGYGGGAYQATLRNCTLIGNSAAYGGGAVSGISGGGTLHNCTLFGNSADFGGGVHGGTVSGGSPSSMLLYNCTLAGNFAWQGGGANNATLNNCIAYDNIAYDNIYNIYLYDNYNRCVLNYSCTTPLPPGPGNLTNAPLFVRLSPESNLRLLSNSPCINAGNNSYAPAGTDLDGYARIKGVQVDIGAYEFQGAGLGEFPGWLWGYGLRVDGSADYLDSDSDQLNNWQEWIAGTVPTDALSALQLLSPTNSAAGIAVSWQSVSNRTYFLERATNLEAVPQFSLLASNLVGQVGATSYTDTNAFGLGPFFYRVGVQQ